MWNATAVFILHIYIYILNHLSRENNEKHYFENRNKQKFGSPFAFFLLCAIRPVRFYIINETCSFIHFTLMNPEREREKESVIICIHYES